MDGLEDESVQLLFTDPPYGTGKVQRLKSSGRGYNDQDEVEALASVLGVAAAAGRVLRPSGVMAVCLDRRIVHSFVHFASRLLTYEGDVIWHYETGGTARIWYSHKHETIALFSKGDPLFNYAEVPTTKRKAPVTRNGKAYAGDKKVSSVWNVNMSTTAGERVGYPNQKPLDLVRPFVRIHTNPGGLVVDPYMGSGTTLVAALMEGRSALGADISVEACEVTERRLAGMPARLPLG